MTCPKCKQQVRVSGVFDDGVFGHICRDPTCRHAFRSRPTPDGRVLA
jgi:hypothetical protein